jgi:hypothetical protein
MTYDAKIFDSAVIARSNHPEKHLPGDSRQVLKNVALILSPESSGVDDSLFSYLEIDAQHYRPALFTSYARTVRVFTIRIYNKYSHKTLAKFLSPVRKIAASLELVQFCQLFARIIDTGQTPTRPWFVTVPS